MTMTRVRRWLGLWLPLACNLGLAGYLTWEFFYVPVYARHLSFKMFAWFYVVGGLVIALSCVTVVLLLVSDKPAGRGHVALALANTVLPTLFMLLLFQLR